MKNVRRARVRGRTRITGKHQATIPVDALRNAGLKVGDELSVESAGAGRIVLKKTGDVMSRYAGCLPGIYADDYLDRLRSEWRS